MPLNQQYLWGQSVPGTIVCYAAQKARSSRLQRHFLGVPLSMTAGTGQGERQRCASLPVPRRSKRQLVEVDASAWCLQGQGIGGAPGAKTLALIAGHMLNCRIHAARNKGNNLSCLNLIFVSSTDITIYLKEYIHHPNLSGMLEGSLLPLICIPQAISGLPILVLQPLKKPGLSMQF